VNAGFFRHRIEIQALTRTGDGGGGGTDAWATIAYGAVNAAITPVSSAETYVGEQLQDYVSHKITLRYVPGVTTAHRVLFGARWFDVKSVIDLQEKHRDMIILAQERAAK
jgi:SPP1 family predicted phage head-tail adaptor